VSLLVPAIRSLLCLEMPGVARQCARQCVPAAILDPDNIFTVASMRAYNTPEEIVALSTSTSLIFGILIAIGYLASPIVLIWGWMRWVKLPKPRTLTSILSLIGLILATASALLAVSLIAHAVVLGGFPYYDPRAMRIYRWGMLLSLAAIVFGIGGIWRPSSLRWHAPVSGICMLIFWIVATEFE
jgi:hypothetical protein